MKICLWVQRYFYFLQFKKKEKRCFKEVFEIKNTSKNKVFVGVFFMK